MLPLILHLAQPLAATVTLALLSAVLRGRSGFFISFLDQALKRPEFLHLIVHFVSLTRNKGGLSSIFLNKCNVIFFIGTLVFGI